MKAAHGSRKLPILCSLAHRTRPYPSVSRWETEPPRDTTYLYRSIFRCGHIQVEMRSNANLCLIGPNCFFIKG